MRRRLFSVVLFGQRVYGFFRRKKTSPEYTRRQWIMKCTQIFLCCVGMEMSGLKLYQLDTDFALRRISYEAAYGLPSLYYWVVNGLCMGLAFWKLLEVYWWGKDHAKL
jgi:hypothetical protein